MHRDSAPQEQLSAATVVAVVGLGYVGLPLAAAFGRRYRTIGLDLSAAKTASYRAHRDPTGEVPESALKEASRLEYTNDPALLSEADLIVVAVPTPVDEAHRPDFAPLAAASEEVGRRMKRGATVIYESTVYPGATEEVCIPLLERASGLAWKRDFHVGYSPERINPGDREHSLEKIVKVVSGDTPGTLEPTNRPYAIAKIAGIELCWSCNRQHGKRFLAAMPTNLYGRGDNYDLENSHVLPALLRKLHGAKQRGERQVTLWGSGQSRREFLYSDDMAAACVHLMRLPEEQFDRPVAPAQAPLVNVGAGKDIPVTELAALVAEVVGYRGQFVYDASKPGGMPLKLLDSSRIAALGWKPATGLREGIALAYQDFQRRYAVRAA